MRVLMIGGGERYHVEPLARCIKRADPKVWLGVNDLREPSASGTLLPVKESAFFDQVYQFPGASSLGGGTSQANSGRAEAGPSAAVVTQPWKLGFRAAWRLFRRRAPKRRAGEHLEQITRGIDLLHVQSLFADMSMRWLLASGRRGFVASCWGSDVLRRCSVEDFVMQQQVLRRAAVITASTPELQEVVLAKYGRDLAPKLCYTFFNPGVEDLRESLRAPQEILSAGAAPTLRVCIGHNGFPDGNHEALLSGFACLPDAVKTRIELIVPLTYGGAAAYRARVRAAAERTGCRVRLLESFLSEAEVRRLRAETDILVFAPVSDALSATVTQALASASVVICGAWLSYRARTRAGFRYREIERPEDAAATVGQVIEDWEREVSHALGNRELAFKCFSEVSIGEGWVAAYRKALSSISVH